MRIAILLSALLAACGQEAPSLDNDSRPGNPLPNPAAPAPRAFVFDEKNELIEFHFGWSAEAARVPQLVDRFRKEMEKGQADLVAGAEEDKAYREKEGFDFHGFMSTTDYKTAGQSARLLSLSIESGSYTGGAHGNYGIGSLLWDRIDAKDVEAANLFAEPANMARVLTDRWCEALNQAREEKRREPVGGGGMFDDCPALDDIAIIPADKDGNGKFERMMLVASPYVAGPWVEGAYEIELPVTPDLLATLKGDYRTSFEAAQAQ